jgi:DNA-binding XRE family transcriptional regulator
MENEVKQKVEKILEKVRIQRTIIGYSQEYVGEQLGLSQYAYHKIENGKTKLNIECLLNLSDILEIEMKELF